MAIHIKTDAMSKLNIIVVSLCGLFSIGCTTAPHSQEVHLQEASHTVLSVQSGLSDDGRPTSAWIASIESRHDEDALARLQESQKDLTQEERLLDGCCEKCERSSSFSLLVLGSIFCERPSGRFRVNSWGYQDFADVSESFHIQLSR